MYVIILPLRKFCYANAPSRIFRIFNDYSCNVTYSVFTIFNNKFQVTDYHLISCFISINTLHFGFLNQYGKTLKQNHKKNEKSRYFYLHLKNNVTALA